MVLGGGVGAFVRNRKAGFARQSEAHVASVDEVGCKSAGLAPREDREAAFVHMAGKDLEGEDDL